MKITLVMVASLNGKITKGNDPHIYSWTSPQDTKLFFSLLDKNNLIVMGSKTYESAKDKIKLQKDKLRVVITRNPQKYMREEIIDRLEFSSLPPLQLVKSLEKRGYNKMLLVGGGEINALFFKANLVNKLLLTIEPLLFGTGADLIAPTKLTARLKLHSVKKLNSQGTLLLSYKIL